MAYIMQRYIANKSNTTMVSAYASSLHPSHIYLQRGYRIYGQPNVEDNIIVIGIAD